MVTLIIAAAGLTVAAIVVTIYAYLTAKNGFEDEEGFHALITPGGKATTAKDKDNDELSSLFPEPHSH